MNPIKAQIKIGTINELGSKYDDMLEAAQKEVIRKEGFHIALNEVQNQTLKSIFDRVDADRDAGRFDLPAASFVKEYLAKVHAAVDNLRIMNEKHRLIAEGRVIGLKDAIGFAKKSVDAEKSKLEALESQVATGAVQPEASGVLPVDVRPDANVSALDDLNRRRALARANKPTEEAQSMPAAAVAPVIELAPVDSKPARKGRPRGSKNRPKEARG